MPRNSQPGSSQLLESRIPSGIPEVQWRLPHSLTILATYGCTAACKQCCFQSNPSIKHRVPQARLLEYLDQAAEVGTIRLVCFSGGEPFLLGDDLVELVERAAKLGFMTRIVTNGYWAKTRGSALRRLERLVEVGLNEINFSTGDDHTEFVTIETVALGIQVSLELGLGLALMIEAGAQRKVTRQTVIEAARDHALLRRAIDEGLFAILESPWMDFAPDGEHVVPLADQVANRHNLHLKEGCTSVLTTVVVTPNEDLGLCCGLPRESIPDLRAGSLRDARMKDLVRGACHDFLKIWLFVEGPERILAWAAEKDPSIEWENLYAHNCDACRRLYQDPKVLAVIAEHYGEKRDEILFQYSVFLEQQPAVADEGSQPKVSQPPGDEGGPGRSR